MINVLFNPHCTPPPQTSSSSSIPETLVLGHSVSFSFACLFLKLHICMDSQFLFSVKFCCCFVHFCPRYFCMVSSLFRWNHLKAKRLAWLPWQPGRQLFSPVSFPPADSPTLRCSRGPVHQSRRGRRGTQCPRDLTQAWGTRLTLSPSPSCLPGHWRVHFGGQGCENQEEREHLQPQRGLCQGVRARRHRVHPEEEVPPGEWGPGQGPRWRTHMLVHASPWRLQAAGVAGAGIPQSADPMRKVPSVLATGTPALGCQSPRAVSASATVSWQKKIWMIKSARWMSSWAVKRFPLWSLMSGARSVVLLPGCLPGAATGLLAAISRLRVSFLVPFWRG